jgi:alcohol dehydrogenase class IV
MGTDVRLLAGQYFKNLGVGKVLVVTDKIIQKQLWYTDIIESISLSGISYVEYNNTSPNPKEIEVMEGGEVFINESCQGIFAIGGGSVIDCAKGIGVVFSNKRHILEFEGVDKIEKPTPPIISVPTTAGTSADVSQFSIIRDMDRMVKIAIISKSLVPDLALIDPVVSVSMDSYLTACTGMDALTHAFEAFVSTGSSPVTDNHALNGIRLILDNLYNAVNKPNDITARYNMMIGSLEAGLAFSNASLGAVHSMAHSLGGYYDSPHGECNALLLDHIVRFNYASAPERYNFLGSLFGLELKKLSRLEKQKALSNSIAQLRKSIGLDYSLAKMGVRADDINILSKNAINDPCILTNPRNTKLDDIKVIYSEAI